MITHQLFDVPLAFFTVRHHHVVAYPGADEYLFYARYLHEPVEKLYLAPVSEPKVRADLRHKAAFLRTGESALRAESGVHVRGRPSDVIDDAVEPLFLGKDFCFLFYGAAASRYYCFALVNGYSAETAFAEAAPVRGDRLFYGFKRPYLSCFIVGVGVTFEFQSVHVV